MKNLFEKNLKKIDVESLIIDFDLDIKGMAKVDINGKKKIVQIEHNEELYKCKVNGIEFETTAISDSVAINHFRKATFKTFGKQSIPKEISVFRKGNWEVLKNIKRIRK